MPTSQSPDDFRPEENPITWFAEMLIALDRGNFRRASEAQDELARLGWRVDRQKRRRARTVKGAATT
jgi:hypothetical protein